MVYKRGCHPGISLINHLLILAGPIGSGYFLFPGLNKPAVSWNLRFLLVSSLAMPAACPWTYYRTFGNLQHGLMLKAGRWLNLDCRNHCHRSPSWQILSMISCIWRSTQDVNTGRHFTWCKNILGMSTCSDTRYLSTFKLVVQVLSSPRSHTAIIRPCGGLLQWWMNESWQSVLNHYYIVALRLLPIIHPETERYGEPTENYHNVLIRFPDSNNRPKETSLEPGFSSLQDCIPVYVEEIEEDR